MTKMSLDMQQLRGEYVAPESVVFSVIFDSQLCQMSRGASTEDIEDEETYTW
ncbi:MAG: hypothetical protein IJS07_05210 [Bacteroidales bacterium]|nr:hypothetical protein [Bacteroidales bacterium]